MGRSVIINTKFEKLSFKLHGNPKFIFSLLVAVAFNALCVYPFAVSLIDPINNVDFIYRAGFAVFLIEFFSLHAMFLLNGAILTKKYYVVGLVLSIYLVIVSLFSFAITGGPYVLIVFLGSIASKIRTNKGKNSNMIQSGVYRTILLLLSVMLAIIAGSFITSLFPLPPEVIAQKPFALSGTFVDTPQVLMLFGILYYSLETVIDIGEINRRSNKEQK